MSEFEVIYGKARVVVAIKDMCTGNESVGEMWKETKVFNLDAPLRDVMEWVNSATKNVVLTIPKQD